MILIDTSVWVEFLRGTPTGAHLADLIADDAPLACTEPVLMEIEAGARSRGERDDLRRMLTAFAWIPVDPAADFEGAAAIYSLCRAGGITPRGLIDCMIASVAMRVDAAVLTSDRDFAAMSQVLPLRLAA